MREQSFYDWLMNEVASSRRALIGLYEQRDKLLHIEAPPLRKRYMETIGVYEEDVLQAELDVAMLRRKAEMIQIFVNQRLPVDLQDIDAAIEAEREQTVSELEAGDRTLYEFPQLSEQEKHTLQRQHREITASFHPAFNPDVTEAQKELYEKAQEAYRMQDLEAMQLIYDMLFMRLGSPDISVSRESLTPVAEEPRQVYRELASALTTDYTLAKKLYSFFMPLEEDTVVRDALNTYDAQRRALEAEITEIKAGFPFNALSTLNDKRKTEEYLEELRVRARWCEREKAELEQRIKDLTEGAANG